MLGDAVLAIFPGETTIVTAAVLAADDQLELFPIIVAGAAGAILGDSILYWIGVKGNGPLRKLLVKHAGQERADRAYVLFEEQGPTLILLSRFIPGVRWIVNFAAGGVFPYRRFLPYSAAGGVLWSAQTALLAYLFGTAFDQAWLSIAASFGISTLIFAAVFSVKRRNARSERPPTVPTGGDV